MPAWRLLPFTMQPQAQTNWCWAAVAVSVAAFFDAATRATQCSLANGELRRQDCCGKGGGRSCNLYGYLASALNRVGRLRVWRPSRAATPNEMQAEVDGSRPLCLRIAWASGGAHFLALIGYLPDGVAPIRNLVMVADPRWGVSVLPYDVLRKAYRQEGRWTDTYFTRPDGARPDDA